jgi:hypothetical protein
VLVLVDAVSRIRCGTTSTCIGAAPARASLRASWNDRLVQSSTISMSSTRASSYIPHATVTSRTSVRPELAPAPAFLGVSSGEGVA